MDPGVLGPLGFELHVVLYLFLLPDGHLAVVGVVIRVVHFDGVVTRAALDLVCPAFRSLGPVGIILVVQGHIRTPHCLPGLAIGDSSVDPGVLGPLGFELHVVLHLVPLPHLHLAVMGFVIWMVHFDGVVTRAALDLVGSAPRSLGPVRVILVGKVHVRIPHRVPGLAVGNGPVDPGVLGPLGFELHVVLHLVPLPHLHLAVMGFVIAMVNLDCVFTRAALDLVVTFVIGPGVVPFVIIVQVHRCPINGVSGLAVGDGSMNPGVLPGLRCEFGIVFEFVTVPDGEAVPIPLVIVVIDLEGVAPLLDPQFIIPVPVGAGPVVSSVAVLIPLLIVHVDICIGHRIARLFIGDVTVQQGFDIELHVLPDLLADTHGDRVLVIVVVLVIG